MREKLAPILFEDDNSKPSTCSASRRSQKRKVDFQPNLLLYIEIGAVFPEKFGLACASRPSRRPVFVRRGSTGETESVNLWCRRDCVHPRKRADVDRVWTRELLVTPSRLTGRFPSGPIATRQTAVIRGRPSIMYNVGLRAEDSNRRAV